jgi:DNA-binding transcriptional regulator LsrR (DeoR family)
VSDEKKRPLAIRVIERERQQPIEDILSGLYSRGLNQREVASNLGVPLYTLARWERELRMRKIISVSFEKATAA